MEKCEICESEEFISEGGFYFCSSCGTQSQQQGEEAMFISDEIESSQLALPSVVKEKESIGPEEEKLSILDKFQRILLLQCDALVSLGCDCSVKEAVKLVWFRYLHYSGYAFETVELKPFSRTMHDDLPEKKLRFKKNRRVRSTPVLKPIPLIPVTSESQKLLSPSCDTSPSSLTTKANDTSHYPSNSESLYESESTVSSPSRSRKKRRKQKLKTSENVSESEASSRELFVKRECAETGGTEQEDDVLQMALGSSQEETKSELVQINSTPELFELENEFETKPYSLEQSLSQFPEIAGFFDDSNSSDEEGAVLSANGAEKTKEEVDQYYMSLKTQLGSSHMRVLSLKHTLAICYLGLLYTQHNIILSDFARWVDINKLPYYNVLGLLPESCRKGRLANMFRPKARDVTADNLYVYLRFFCWYLPLPPLPAIKAVTMCQILIGKLHLPEHFNKIVEKFLRCIEKPKFDGVFLYTHRTFDIQCMAVIVYLLRMVYTLNDITEFDMVELVREEGDTTSHSEEYIYPFEDWIALYSKIKINNLSKSVPTCRSELLFLTSPKNFVDYCFDMFQLSIHSNPPDRDSETNKPVDSSSHAELLDTLRRAQAKVEKLSGKKEPSNVQLKLPTPRRIYISDLRASRYSAWHQCDELQRDSKKNRFHEIELSHSFRFLLQTCCEILDVPATELYEKVCTVDSQVVHASMTLKKFYATIPKASRKKVKPRKEQVSQQTQTEDALFPFLSLPPDDNSPEDPSSRIPVRPWMFVPENTNPEICIPDFRRKYEKKVQTVKEKMYPRLSLLSKCSAPNNEFNRALLEERLSVSATVVPPDDVSSSMESQSNDSVSDEDSSVLATDSGSLDTSVMETDSISSSASD